MSDHDKETPGSPEKPVKEPLVEALRDASAPPLVDEAIGGEPVAAESAPAIAPTTTPAAPPQFVRNAAPPPPPGGRSPTPPPTMGTRPPQGYGPPPPGYPGYAPPTGYQQPPMGPPPGYRPPGFGNTSPKKSGRSVGMIVGLVVLLVAVFGGGALLFSSMAESFGSAGATGGTASSGMFVFGDRIAVLEVEGAIGEGTGYQANTALLIKQIRDWQTNSSVKGIVVRVNSPGGTVGATQELYDALIEYKQATNNPVVSSFGDIAASGGYYTAMATDQIFANPGTLTGSIGVILNFMDYQGLQQKVGVRSRAVKSGEFKDIGSGSRAMTAEEAELLNEMVLDVYDQFLDSVIENRHTAIRKVLAETLGTRENQITPAQVEEHARRYADGRIFSGQQAYKSGMIDHLGNQDDAIRWIASMQGITGDPKTVRGPIRPRGLFGALTTKVQALESMAPGGMRLEYRMAF